MHKNKIVLLSSIFLLVLLAGFGLFQSFAPKSSSPATLAEAQVLSAPNFTVYDVNGHPAQLQDFQGQPLVLNFWASWCGPCRSEMGYFNQLHQELQGKVHFLMVNVTDGRRETVAKASSFVEMNGYGFPVYYDTDMDAATKYNIFALPTTFFIDAQGNIVSQIPGALTPEALQANVQKIYQE